MIEGTSKDLDITTDDAIKILAKYYDTTERHIKETLAAADSLFVGPNRIVYYEGDKAIRNRTFYNSFRNIIRKIDDKIGLSDDIVVDDDVIVIADTIVDGIENG